MSTEIYIPERYQEAKCIGVSSYIYFAGKTKRSKVEGPGGARRRLQIETIDILYIIYIQTRATRMTWCWDYNKLDFHSEVPGFPSLQLYSINAARKLKLKASIYKIGQNVVAASSLFTAPIIFQVHSPPRIYIYIYKRSKVLDWYTIQTDGKWCYVDLHSNPRVAYSIFNRWDWDDSGNNNNAQ